MVVPLFSLDRLCTITFSESANTFEFDKSCPLSDVILQEESIASHQILFVGDDITDLDVIENVGLFVAVCNAHKMVKNKAHYITQKAGGQGAVREVCDLIEYSNQKVIDD